MPDKKEENKEERTLRKAREEIVRSQVERFHKDYNEYFNTPETEKLVKYFFEQIYDLEAQDTIIQIAINTYHKVKNHLSQPIRENLENIIELNQLTHVLDKRMAEHLLRNGWKEGEKISIDDYFKLYKEVGLEAERREQLVSVIKGMLVSYQLAHRPFNDVLIKAAKGFAIMFGVMPLYHFVNDGYKATVAVSSEVFNKFVDKVTQVELAYINKAFGE
jgi:regulator of replication initiation timing